MQPIQPATRERLRTVSSSESSGQLTDAEGYSQSVTILDVAGHDLLLLHDRPVAPGGRVSLVVEGAELSNAVCLSGITHWSRARSSRWESGIALPVEAPTELLFVAGGSSREAIRFAFHQTGTVRETGGGLVCPANSINYSRDGFCLSCTAKVASGSTILFSWETHSSEGVTALCHTVSAFVRWSSDVAGSFLIGCDLISGTRYALSGIDVDEQMRKLVHRQRKNWSIVLGTPSLSCSTAESAT